VKGQPAPFSVEVWLDQKTGLPVRRAITFRIAGNVSTITEDYEKLALDEKIDVKLFKLPK
jgi:outer membrane lipoprotein-sorting protein